MDRRRDVPLARSHGSNPSLGRVRIIRQRITELGDGAEPIRGGFRQRLEDRGLHGFRNRIPQDPRPDRLFGQQLRDDGL